MKLTRDQNGGQGLPNLTPFIDMMFILIIFFLATSRFHEAERDEAIRLARTKNTMPISTPADTLVININKDGEKFVDGDMRDLNRLEQLVRRYKKKNPGGEVVIRADTRGKVGSLAETLEICHRVGFETPNVSYETAAE